MKTIVTESGLIMLRERLLEKIVQLKALREEKAHAYSASGDGWHDNPGWTQLGQQEELLAKEVSLLQQKISNAKLIDYSVLDADRVNLGCLVDFLIYKDGGKIKQSLKIVGSGESDVRNKCISYDSPIGKALYNMSIAEEKEIDLPSGKVKLKVEAIRYE